MKFTKKDVDEVFLFPILDFNVNKLTILSQQMNLIVFWGKKHDLLFMALDVKV